MMTPTFTDEELLSYTEERLPVERAAFLEQHLRASNELLDRLKQVIQATDRGDVTLGGMWRRGRWSCPSRGVWHAFVSGRLGDGMSQYLRFHVETIGCRLCQASLHDLQTTEQSVESDDRIRKIFQSSTGVFKRQQEGNSGGSD